MYTTQTAPKASSTQLVGIPARDQMPVERAMAQLDDSLARLNAVIESLLPRLSMVSRPLAENGVAGRDREPAECVLVDQIVSSALYVDHLADVLVTARERLCI